MPIRRIHSIRRSRPTIEGAGVHLKRGFGFGEVPEFDPFLMLDAFDSRNPADYVKGFPWHPHRGIETVTYLIAGDIEHGDSLGNKGHILDGGCQWMYVLGTRQPGDEVSFPVEGVDGGSMSMLAVQLG